MGGNPREEDVGPGKPVLITVEKGWDSAATHWGWRNRSGQGEDTSDG